MTVYYDIFETDMYIEYHCSIEKQEVIDHASMSRRIKKDHPDAVEARSRWVSEIDLLRLVHVKTEGSVV
jgi:hypothetical protein